MTELLSNKMDRSIIGALLTGHAQEEWNELKAETVVLEENLAEYENDETRRRREDALKIRTLEHGCGMDGCLWEEA